MNKKTLILLPAMMMLLTGCGENTASTTPGTDTSTTDTSATSSLKIAYEAAEALENDGVSEAYTFEGTVVGNSGNSYFVMDGAYGMYVYNDKTISPTVGDAVKVTATLTKYNGLVETKSVSSSEITGKGTVPTAAKVTSLSDISKLKQNVLVDLEVTMPSELKTWSSSSNPLNTCTLGSDAVTIKFDKYGYSDSVGSVYNTTAGKKAVIKNAVTSAYSKDGNTTPTQILFIGTSTIELAA